MEPATKCAYLIVMLLLVRKTSSQCEEVAIHEQSNHSMQVSETFENSTLTLYCNITDGELLHGQQLIWSEGGVEIKDSLTSRYQTSRTSSVLTFSNASDYRYGEYSCRCHNRFNYTVDTIEDYIRNSSNIFSPYCSMSVSTIISPDQAINSLWIVYHEVLTPGEMIQVSCDNNSTSTLLYLLHNMYSEGTVVMWEEPMYTVSMPSDQAKFLCMLEEEVVQVHYVMIKDYSPLKFIVPNTGSWELNVEPNRRTVLCAIVSPREPELLKVSLELDFLGVIDIGTGTSYGYLHAVYSEVSAVALLYDCQAKTAWEDITISYQITTRPRSDNLLFYEIRVYASIYMLLNNTVEVGGRAVVCCRVTGNHHNRVKVSVKYNNSIYDVEMVERGLEYTDYHLVVNDLHKEGYREYICIGELYEHCIRKTNVTYLNVISSNASDHKEDKASSPIRPSHVQATLTSTAATTGDISRHRPTSSSSSNNASTAPASTDVLVTTIIFTIMVVIFLVIVTLLVLICCRRWNRKRRRDTTSNNNYCASDLDSKSSDIDSKSISISLTLPSPLQSRAPSFAP